MIRNKWNHSSDDENEWENTLPPVVNFINILRAAFAHANAVALNFYFTNNYAQLYQYAQLESTSQLLRSMLYAMRQ